MLRLKNYLQFALLGVFLTMPMAQAFDFYAGIVPVNDRSQMSFRQGVNAALLQVLARFSGESPEKLLQNVNLADDLQNAERYTSQFLYKVQTDGTQKQVYLQASFPEKIVMGLVKKGNLRFYAPRKTEILLLPLVKGAGAVSMETGLNEALLNAAQKAGVAVTQGGQRQEDATLLWTADAAYINQLASDYGKKTVVIIQLPEAGEFAGKWIMMEEGKAINAVDINGNNSASFTEQGMAWLAAQLADKTGVELGSKPGKLEMIITGINSYQRYEQVLTYLKQISIVESLSLLSAEADTLNVALNLGTGADQLEKILVAEKKIRIDTAANGQKNYHWNE